MINILLGFVDSGWYYSLSPCPPLGTDAHTQHNRPVYNLWSVWRVCVFSSIWHRWTFRPGTGARLLSNVHTVMACLFLSVATAIDYVGIRNAAVWCLHESKKNNRNLYVAQSNCRRRLQPTKFKTFQTNKRWKSSREEWETAWRKTNQTWNGCVHHRFVMLIVAFIIRSRKC